MCVTFVDYYKQYVGCCRKLKKRITFDKENFLQGDSSSCV